MRIEDRLNKREADILNGYFDRLNELCAEKKINRATLADAIGCNVNTIRRRPYFPNMMTAIDVADYFNVSLEWLMRGEGKKWRTNHH